MSVLLDANLLVYAAMPTSQFHAQARTWLRQQFSDESTTVGFAWSTLYAVARLVSHKAVAGPGALDTGGAWDAALQYTKQPRARIYLPGARHAELASRLVRTPGLGSTDLPDVFLAALAIEHGLELCSHDRGFARFEGLRWRDPLSPD